MDNEEYRMTDYGHNFNINQPLNKSFVGKSVVMYIFQIIFSISLGVSALIPIVIYFELHYLVYSTIFVGVVVLCYIILNFTFFKADPYSGETWLSHTFNSLDKNMTMYSPNILKDEKMVEPVKIIEDVEKTHLTNISPSVIPHVRENKKLSNELDLNNLKVIMGGDLISADLTNFPKINSVIFDNNIKHSMIQPYLTGLGFVKKRVIANNLLLLSNEIGKISSKFYIFWLLSHIGKDDLSDPIYNSPKKEINRYQVISENKKYRFHSGFKEFKRALILYVTYAKDDFQKGIMTKEMLKDIQEIYIDYFMDGEFGLIFNKYINIIRNINDNEHNNKIRPLTQEVQNMYQNKFNFSDGEESLIGFNFNLLDSQTLHNKLISQCVARLINRSSYLNKTFNKLIIINPLLNIKYEIDVSKIKENSNVNIDKQKIINVWASIVNKML